MHKLRVHAQEVRGSFVTSWDCLNDCTDLWVVTLFTEQRQFVFLLCYDQFWLRINELVLLLIVGLLIDSWCCGCFHMFSQCFSVFTSLKDEIENWHSHRGAPCTLNSATVWWYYFILYLDYFTIESSVFFLCFTVSHTIPEEPNWTMRHIDDLVTVSNVQVLLSTLPRCKLRKKKSSRRQCTSWECMRKCYQMLSKS